MNNPIGRLSLLLFVCTASVAITVLAFFPATWLTSLLEQQSSGRFTLGDAHGTLWNGSAFIGGSASESDSVTPLLPGRLIWHLSPMIFLGRVYAKLENVDALSQPVTVIGNWRQWQISPGEISVAADRLTALGAPLNTIKPYGKIRCSWETMQLKLQAGKMDITGYMKFELSNLSSRLSPLKPLGSYDLVMNWQGEHATVSLRTINGPMLLAGNGEFKDGHLQFSGTARAETGQEEKLANLINLLGQKRREGDKDVIALEFN